MMNSDLFSILQHIIANDTRSDEIRELAREALKAEATSIHEFKENCTALSSKLGLDIFPKNGVN